MNYVFGQASLEDRVAVWSLSRLGERTDQTTFLKRTLKIAVHETAHIFGFKHCTKYECVMSGTNSLAETDRRTIDACPECMAKICWMTNTSPRERYEKLAAFCQRYGLTIEAEEFKRKAAAVSQVTMVRSILIYRPISRRNCIPSQLISATASYARDNALSSDSPTAVTPSTRPPDVTNSPAPFFAVPA